VAGGGGISVRIASYNVENLFSRPKAFHADDWSIGEPVLAAYHEVNDLMNQAVYDAADKQRIKALLVELDVYYRNGHGAVRRRLSISPKWAWLRKNRGDFDRQPGDDTKDIEITASGRDSWIGWVELAREATNEVGTRMTAKVIREVDADVVGIVEAEDRPSLLRFNDDLLDNFYRHIMLVDGNDERGIDVGLMTRSGFTIETIRSNVDTQDGTGTVFSRDCPEYEVRTPGGTTIYCLVNHFKSQSGGGGTKRRRQAEKVREIVEGMVAAGRHVVVMGDLNEGPKTNASNAENLMALYDNNSPLLECYTLANFDLGGRDGTFNTCSKGNRLDYVFVSRSLQPLVLGGGVFRCGLWGSRKSRPTNWQTYPEMEQGAHQASDHAAVYVDLNVA
jgi:endonuclease/exonuclease/phosphatase family metal-dependent hydrolase